MQKNTSNPVVELNTILSETFGNDAKGMIARAPMYGHADNCWIIHGKKAATAAKLIARRMNAEMTSEVTGLGKVFTLVW